MKMKIKIGRLNKRKFSQITDSINKQLRGERISALVDSKKSSKRIISEENNKNLENLK
jgi:hypothetical protein